MEKELTDCQREAVINHILSGKTFTQIAEETGRNKSTICRNYNRGVNKLKKFAQYIDIRR